MIMNNMSSSTVSGMQQILHKVRHNGVIAAINSDCVKVDIVQTSACSSCKIANRCSASEMKVKTIDIYDVNNPNKYSIGQEVVVCASMNVAKQALFLGFIIPLAVLMITLLLIYKLTEDEAMAALGALVSLIPYYSVIYMLRDKLKNKLRFWIEEN